MPRPRTITLPPGWSTARWWIDPDRTLRLEADARALVEAIDTRWPPARSTDADHRHWSWRAIFNRAEVRLVVVDAATGEPLAALAMARRHVLAGPPRCLRLDFLEVAPSARGADLGTLAMSLAAEFALDRGCAGLVLGALPGAVGFHVAVGGRADVRPLEWSEPEGTVPVYFDHECLAELKQWADDRRRQG